ncbi:MAG: 23S rRNA (cytidine(2498)-2'-O)-methyltransferase RlmM [Gallionella sp.]|jgi:23S rRNA (cytidine2498-2'-O)-methyltransferase
MQTTPKPKRASTDTAKPRRTDAKQTPDRANAKPRREGGTKAIDAKSAPSARRAPTTPRQTDKTRGTAAPRQTDNKAPGRGNSAPRNGGKPASKITPAPVAAPRRVGTKMSRLLDLNVAPPVTKKPHVATSNNGALTHWLLYCRPGFEQDCTQEAVGQARRQRPVLSEQPGILPNSGYALVAINGQSLAYSDLIFARQLICLHHIIEELPERDRLTPILSAIAALPGTFGTLWLEVPDTNDGKTLTAFTRRFQPLLEAALREQGRLVDTDPAESRKLPRLHIFFPDKSAALIGTSDPYNSADALMGISRQSMPAEAPSRSTLKLAEAIDVFMDKGEQSRLLRSGMTAVDLGAAPGGWTWQMVKRGMRVTAVDNGPMKGVLAKNPAVEHLMQDGFKFTPRKAVDWLICDMVEKPAKVAELIGNWFVSGWCKHAIFNLKLPMKQRVTATDAALGGIRKLLDMEGISYKLIAKQLYHDREEITVFLSKTKNR